MADQDSWALPEVMRELRFESWHTVREGYRMGVLSRTDVIEFADRAIARVERPPTALVSLSSCNEESTHDVTAHLLELADSEPAIAEQVTRDRLRLAMLLHLRRTEADEERLLVRVSEIYGRFGYPKDMKGAVYYIPPPAAYQAQVGDQFPSPVLALDEVIASLRVAIGL